MEQDMCRICLETDNTDDMIYPCMCSGTNKYIHKKCFIQSLAVNDKKCMTCNYEYTFQHRYINPIITLLANYPLISILLEMGLIVSLHFIMPLFNPNKLDQVIGIWNIESSMKSQYYIVSEFIVLGSLHLYLIVVRIYCRENIWVNICHSSCNIIAFMFFNILNIIMVRLADSEVYGSTTIFSIIMMIPINYGFKQCYDKLMTSESVLNYRGAPPPSGSCPWETPGVTEGHSPPV